MYFLSFKSVSLLVFYLPLPSDFSCFVVSAENIAACCGCTKAAIIRLYVLEMYSYSYIILIFYVSETYSLMMAASVQLQQVAIYICYNKELCIDRWPPY
jgi:hypothetical protein